MYLIHRPLPRPKHGFKGCGLKHYLADNQQTFS